MPGFLLRLGNSAASAASRVRRNVHQRNLVVARAFTFPPHSMPVFIDESPGKRRLARNNADWYQLLDLCGMTDTLIGDADGVYHPSFFNDRLVLGLKGTMS